jgi:hypothetical protein
LPLAFAFALPHLCLAIDDSDGIQQDEGQTMAKAGGQEDDEGEGGKAMAIGQQSGEGSKTMGVQA